MKYFCIICGTEIKKPTKDQIKGLAPLVCLQCSDNGSGGVATDPDEKNGDSGEFGLGGDWWKGKE